MTAPRKRAPRKAAASKPSPRERLMGRPRPSAPYRLLVDQAGAEAAQAELAKVVTETRQVLLREPAGSAKHKAAEKRRETARAAVDACYQSITVTAMPPEELEELASEHPPTVEQMAKVKAERDAAKQRGEQLPDWPQYNEVTFFPALLAACTDIGMTADDWSTFLRKNVSDGERRGLKITALNVQYQERNADPLVLPKGSTGMLSSLLS